MQGNLNISIHAPAPSRSRRRRGYLVMSILAEQPNQRLGYLFHLATVEDRRLAEIGAQVHLSQSCGRALS